MAHRKKGGHGHKEEEGGEAWLLPYSDLMTLLLAVFIVLFAVSKVDAEKAKAMSDTFSESMMSKNYTVSEKLQSKEAVTEKSVEPGEAEQLETLKAEVDKKLQESGMAAAVTTSIDARGLIISFNNAIFFESGSAEIKKENEHAMMECNLS